MQVLREEIPHRARVRVVVAGREVAHEAARGFDDERIGEGSVDEAPHGVERLQGPEHARGERVFRYRDGHRLL